METEPRYTAARAANVVLAMAAVAALTSIGSGVVYVLQGSPSGWLLVVVGALPLLVALLIRTRVK